MNLPNLPQSLSKLGLNSKDREISHKQDHDPDPQGTGEQADQYSMKANLTFTANTFSFTFFL